MPIGSPPDAPAPDKTRIKQFVNPHDLKRGNGARGCVIITVSGEVTADDIAKALKEQYDKIK